MSEQRSQTWHRQSSHPWETKAGVVTQHHPMGHRGHSHLCNNWSLREGQKWQSVLNNATLSTWVLEKHITCQPRNWKKKEKKEYKRAVQTSQSSRQSGKGNKIYFFFFLTLVPITGCSPGGRVSSPILEQRRGSQGSSGMTCPRAGCFSLQLRRASLNSSKDFSGNFFKCVLPQGKISLPWRLTKPIFLYLNLLSFQSTLFLPNEERLSEC